jgi:hypothetical protein
MIEGWFETYPRLFCYPSKKEQEGFRRAISAGKYKDCDRERVQIRISTYADLYVYLFFHAARFLKPGGRMGIITSNAWLDVNYGYELQRFFCDHFKIVAIMESRCEPWFTEASVNTVYTIIERCEDPKELGRHLVKFVKVKKRLAALVPADPQVQAMERWQRLRRLTERIESAGRKDAKTVPLGLVTEEDENFRIRVCRQSELREEIKQEEKTVKWGRFLRAPEVYFDLLRKGRFCLLKEVAMPKRGGLTRINKFFHVAQEVAEHFGIEDEYLLPFIKSPKDSSRIAITVDEIDLRVFVCRRSKTELKNLGHKGALKYIEWGETQTYERGEFQGLPWPEGTWVAKRQPGWYALPNAETTLARVFFTRAIGDRHMHRYSPDDIIPDVRLYFLTAGVSLNDEIIAACLNSSLCAFCCEIAGRVTMGDGVLELTVEDARDYLLVPDVSKVSAVERKAVTKAFEALCKREIGNVFEEVKQKDRRALDAAILAAIGVDPKKYLKPIYEGLCELVQERMGLGEQRGKMRKTKARKTNAEKEIFQQVLDEVLPDGPKRFPEDFLSHALPKDERIEVALPETPLRLDVSPMYVTVYAGASTFRQVKYSAEGKFIIYCQQAGQSVAAMPSKRVEVTRTVANYEDYLRDLRKTLYDTFYRRTLDVSVAARLTQAAFDRFKLPAVDTR